LVFNPNLKEFRRCKSASVSAVGRAVKVEYSENLQIGIQSSCINVCMLIHPSPGPKWIYPDAQNGHNGVSAAPFLQNFTFAKNSFCVSVNKQFIDLGPESANQNVVFTITFSSSVLTVLFQF